MRAHYVVPVDLNALVYMNYTSLSEFHALLGDAARAEEFAGKAGRLKEAIASLLWHPEDRTWYDFDLVHERPRTFFYPSNLFPLWAECYDKEDRGAMAEAACDYLKRTKAIYCK